ncbi:MAG: hypothetical protein WAN70_00345 [Terriglobales bacterium]|jgi:hypothetical protein
MTLAATTLTTHKMLLQILRNKVVFIPKLDCSRVPDACQHWAGKSNLLRRSLHPILREMGKPLCGFHAFRRFRAEHLENALPGSDVLRKLWMGHTLSDVSEKYVVNLKRNTLVRTMSAQKAGLGFELRPSAPTSTVANSLKDWSALADDFRTLVFSQDSGCLLPPRGETAVSGISA